MDGALITLPTLPLVLRDENDGVMTREMALAQEPPHFCSPDWQRGDHHAKSKRPNLSAQMNGAKVFRPPKGLGDSEDMRGERSCPRTQRWQHHHSHKSG